MMVVEDVTALATKLAVLLRRKATKNAAVPQWQCEKSHVYYRKDVKAMLGEVLLQRLILSSSLAELRCGAAAEPLDQFCPLSILWHDVAAAVGDTVLIAYAEAHRQAKETV